MPSPASSAFRRRIRETFERYLDTDSRDARGIVGAINTHGKLYEALILGWLAQQLTREEHCQLKLSRGSVIRLKGAPGPINRAYGTIEVRRNKQLIGELWTDVEFLGLSHAIAGSGRVPSAADYHELDLMLARPGLSGRPRHDQVMLGAECKNTTFLKRHFREILGLRRELSLFDAHGQRTSFEQWPTSILRAKPSSCLMLYSSDPAVTSYAVSATVFSIHIEHVATA